MGMIPKDVRITVAMKLVDMIITKLGAWLDKRIAKNSKPDFF